MSFDPRNPPQTFTSCPIPGSIDVQCLSGQTAYSDQLAIVMSTNDAHPASFRSLATR